MRDSHKQAPFHRIESWNGTYYRPASLWEVGSYLLVQHHQDDGLCETLQFQKKFLDSQQLKEDIGEQKRLQIQRNTTSFPSGMPSATDIEMADGDIEMNDDAIDDIAFENELNGWLDGSKTDDIFDENFESGNAETDIPNIVEYLTPSNNVPASATGSAFPTGSDVFTDSDVFTESGTATESATATGSAGDYPVFDQANSSSTPKADGLNNIYVRVLHTNGIHHIGLVTCSCHGQDTTALDLFACRLLPASFIRIRTIFTAQLMDYFRLCNLELKASAYQFYQLIRRLTLPMGQADMVNLYHEFRRMSRLWRWMKKLKWAGYGHNKQDCLNPPAGSLSIFCPTCPQPGSNLPEDWKLDKNR
jgi:hypothetical protein